MTKLQLDEVEELPGVFDPGTVREAVGARHSLKGAAGVDLSAQGTKFDEGKTRWDLFPYDALEEVGKVLTYGATKYADRNWEKGIRYGRCFGGLMRHARAWWMGEDLDPETGLSHLAHAICCALFLLSFTLRGQREFDDRPRRGA